jgi:hypothetical protein
VSGLIGGFTSESEVETAGDSHIDMIDMIPSEREVEEIRRKEESNTLKT